MYYIEPGYRSLLKNLNLDTLDRVMQFSATQIKDQRGRRDVLRVPITTPQGSHSSIFIKRLWKSRVKDALWSLIKHGSVWSKARTEFEFYKVLQSRDFATARPAAYGEICTPIGERFSCIITEGAPGMPFDDWLLTNPPLAQRRAALRALGTWVRELHDAGIAFPDLFARHVFYDPHHAPGISPFHLIDVARLDVKKHGVSTTLRIRDLAALCAGTPLRHCPLSDRLRLLKSYEPSRQTRQTLKRGIIVRMHTLLKRSKFADFASR